MKNSHIKRHLEELGFVIPQNIGDIFIEDLSGSFHSVIDTKVDEDGDLILIVDDPGE